MAINDAVNCALKWSQNTSKSANDGSSTWKLFKVVFEIGGGRGMDCVCGGGGLKTDRRGHKKPRMHSMADFISAKMSTRY